MRVPLAGGFPQYRPHHAEVAAPESSAALPDGLFVTGASYDGIGIPACIADARATAGRWPRSSIRDGSERDPTQVRRGVRAQSARKILAQKGAPLARLLAAGLDA